MMDLWWCTLASVVIGLMVMYSWHDSCYTKPTAGFREQFSSQLCSNWLLSQDSIENLNPVTFLVWRPFNTQVPRPLASLPRASPRTSQISPFPRSSPSTVNIQCQKLYITKSSGSLAIIRFTKRTCETIPLRSPKELQKLNLSSDRVSAHTIRTQFGLLIPRMTLILRWSLFRRDTRHDSCYTLC